MQYEISAVYAAILGLLTAGLGFGAVIMRVRSGISWGQGDSFPLQRAVRAHGNLTEYAPIFLIILLILENAGASHAWLHGLGAMFVTGRFVSALYFWVAQKFALRVIALWGAVLPIVAGAMLLLLQA